LRALESGDLFRGSTRDLGEQLVAVEDAEDCVGFLDGDGAAGLADTDLDLPLGDADAAGRADAPFDAWSGSGRCGCRACGPGVTDPAYFCGTQRIRQGAEHGPVGTEQMQYAVLDADSFSAPGEVVSHRVLTSGQGEQTGAVDVPFHLDGGA